jgi:hypothetical protein
MILDFIKKIFLFIFSKKKQDVVSVAPEMVKPINKESKMIIYNISKDDEYHTQRNNKFFPISTCNTTSIIMALDAIGVKYSFTQGMQAEDYLTQITETKESYDKMRRDFSWAIKGGYAPRMVHGMLEWATNKMVGKQVDKFSTNYSMQSLILALINKKGVVVSGRFTASGHIVCMVGFESTQENILQATAENQIQLDKIVNIIVDDPYGNYYTDYKDVAGNNTKFPLADFNNLTASYNDLNNKWAHVITNC